MREWRWLLACLVVMAFIWVLVAACVLGLTLLVWGVQAIETGGAGCVQKRCETTITASAAWRSRWSAES